MAVQVLVFGMRNEKDGEPLLLQPLDADSLRDLLRTR